MTSTGDLPEGDLIAAAEYVLGLLDATEREVFEGRMRESGILREAVAEWEGDLAGLAAALPERTVPAHLLARIERELFGEAAPGERAKTGFGWMRALIGAGALAAAVWGVAFFGGLGTAPPPETGLVVATLQSDGHPLRVQARYDDAARVLSVISLTGPAADGRAHELWFIEGENAPVSLGLLPGDGALHIPLPADIVARLQGALLAVSDEPATGSPTGGPTGAVLAAGAVSL